MQSIFVRFVTLCFLFVLLACDQTENLPQESTVIEVTDFTGQTVRLDKPAKKIVALAPHIVENVFTAGAGKQLIGVVEHSDYPEAAKSIPIIGGYEKTNHEKILEIDPDLIIAWESGNSHSSVERLKALGYTVYIDQPDSLRDVAKSILDIGTLTGNFTFAKQASDAYLNELDKTINNYQHKKKVSSFYQVWDQPLQTISGNHIISNAIEICGGANIYANEFAVAPIINIESILERNPSAIIASGMSDARPDWLDDWKQWPSLQAVQNDNLFFVDPDHIQRHTVRLLLGIEKICAQLDTVRERNTP